MNIKKDSIEALIKYFEHEIFNVAYAIINNKREINRIAEEQRKLKDRRKYFYSLVSDLRKK